MVHFLHSIKLGDKNSNCRFCAHQNDDRVISFVLYVIKTSVAFIFGWWNKYDT
jgi:hypothetical protein